MSEKEYKYQWWFGYLWESKDGWQRLRWWALPALWVFWTLQSIKRGYFSFGLITVYWTAAVSALAWVNVHDALEGIKETAQLLEGIACRIERSEQ